MKSRRSSKIFFFVVALALYCVSASLSQTPTENPIQPGRVIEKVIIQSHPDESYALFLPSNYTNETSWPIVFCLDPRARGKAAIERFATAAEKYGYIVVCSNNSRNGLNWSVVSEIFSNFWEDVHNRFNIDEKRTYAAGFSGGSRLASTYASRCRGCLAGVIGAGAGFPADIAPDAKTSFAYFGIVGVDDFNFGEMWQLEKKLSKLSAPYHFENFAGGHEWAPQENLDHALAWFSLQAMRSRSTSKNEAFIEAQFNSRALNANELLVNRQFLDAAAAFSSIVRDFQDLRDVKTAVSRTEELAKSDDLKKEAKAEEDLYRQQLREAGEIRMLWLKAPQPEDSSPGRPVAVERLNAWKKKKELPNDSKDRRLARRILSHLLIEAFETSQASQRNNDYTGALTNLELARAIDGKNANTAYEIARIHALKRERKAALESLEEAVTLGFKDLARLKAEDAFSNITSDPRFEKLLNALSVQ